MKINEKSLSKYASSGAPPDKEGYLHKRGGDYNRGFQKRWFVLKGNLFFYYEKRTDKDPVGVIILEGCTIELSDHEDGFTFMIHYPGSGTRTYILSADTQEEMEEWMKVLSCASYDYMKICVNELKSQLSDIDSKNNKTLLQTVLEESNQFSRSTKLFDNVRQGSSAIGASMSTSSSNSSVSSKRYNPFNSEDALEGENINGRKSEVEKIARTFKEMHEEFGQQITDVVNEWKKKNKHKHLFPDLD